MVKLFCRIVGARGNAFPVDIDKSYTVGQLKMVVAEKKEYESGGDKLQLFLARKDGVWLGEARAAAVMLDEDNKLRGFGDPMDPALRLEDPKYFGEEFQPEKRRVHVLVVIPRQELSANPSLGFPILRRHSCGLHLKEPHLSRDELVMKLYEYVTDTNLVLLSSPPGTGKSSLLTLFGERYAEIFRLKTIAFYDPKADATALLNAEGIDIANRTCHLSTDKSWVFMLIDCQRQYGDVAFWTELIKSTTSWLPYHVRFIISTRRLLETQVPTSPVRFNSIPVKLTKNDLLITNGEAYECLTMENGLSTSFQFPTFLEIIVRECKGHVGSLCVSINGIHAHFLQNQEPTEEELMAFYLSGKFTNLLARCFGRHSKPASPRLQELLINCMLHGTPQVLVGLLLTHEEENCISTLRDVGIITDDCSSVKFTSPLAERYYSDLLFPDRAYEDPSSLHELIRKTIRSMSAFALDQCEADFPNEALLRCQFMKALALHTRLTSEICHELPRVFSNSPRQRSARVDREITFYLNGNLRWGIELLVNGGKTGESISQFAAGGKYAALGAKDYAIIDFRSGISTEVVRNPKRVTVMFEPGNFSTCRCIFGD